MTAKVCKQAYSAVEKKGELMSQKLFLRNKKGHHHSGGKSPYFCHPMLQNWLKSIPTSFCKNAVDPLPDWSFGKNILLHRSEIPDLKKVRAAIIGVGEKEANLIREQLYRCSFPFPKGSVADLGNLRKADAALIIPVLFELLSGKVLPIIIAGNEELARAQFLAYQEAKALVNMAVVDESFRK